uniref:Arrestin_C domain-containing protein n=1 Tax=Caenorhabditis japonica TaxID=281687 RepID=A0A8R1ESD3_CAEJA
MLDNTVIRFDRLDARYLPGDMVTGDVIMHTVEPISARFLKISWHGEASVDFSKNTRKIYLSNYKMVWQSKNGVNQFPAGDHCFRFSFRIPADCPPNHCGYYGKIDYWIAVEMDRPWRRNLEGFKTFYVSKQTDLTSIDKSFLCPARFKNHRLSGTIFVDGGFTVQVIMSKRLFHLGETIRATVKIHNNTDKPIVSLKSDLVKQSHYHAMPNHQLCPMSTSQSCPLKAKHRRDEEEVLNSGEHAIHVAPFHTKHLDMKLTPHSALTPSFESDLVSIGYLWCFTVKSASLTGKELQCNARIVVVSEKKKTTTKKYTWDATIPPPPYSPRNDQI